VSVSWFKGSTFKGSEVREQRTEDRGQMTDENRSVGAALCGCQEPVAKYQTRNAYLKP